MHKFIEITPDDVKADSWQMTQTLMRKASAQARRENKGLRLVLTGDIERKEQVPYSRLLVDCSDEVVVRGANKPERCLKRRY